MSPLPTMSLRAAPEHHALLRDIARAIRTRPELAYVLRDVIRCDTQGDMPQRNADEGVLQDVLRRVAEHDDVLRDVLRHVAELFDVTAPFRCREATLEELNQLIELPPNMAFVQDDPVDADEPSPEGATVAAGAQVAAEGAEMPTNRRRRQKPPRCRTKPCLRMASGSGTPAAAA